MRCFRRNHRRTSIEMRLFEIRLGVIMSELSDVAARVAASAATAIAVLEAEKANSADSAAAVITLNATADSLDAAAAA